MSKKQLVISIIKLELELTIGNIDLKDLCCYISLNRSLMDVVLLSDSASASSININVGADIINLVIK